MNTRKRLMALSGSVLLGVAGVANADVAKGTDLSAEVAALKAEVAQLKGQQQDNWLNERRAEEVKSLVREVLADADTRASLLENGMAAGHNGSKFFLASEDGSFLMNIGGQVQIRHIYNSADDDTSNGVEIDEEENGFQLRRTKLSFDGHVGSPKIGYEIVLAADRDSETVVAEDVILSYDLTDTVEIAGGRMKIPFLREELISSKRQLAVDRSSMTEAFTLNRGEGIRMTWEAMENLVVAAMVSDGSQSGEPGGLGNDFQNDASTFAVTARVDWAAVGSLKQGADYSAWSGEEMAVLLGAAIHYEEAETGIAGIGYSDFWGWTVDGGVEVAGFNLYASVVNMNVNPDAGPRAGHWGYQVQAGYMVIPDKLEPFVRWERLDLYNNGASNADLLTFGANYYINKHAAKFTLDLVWAYEPLTAADTATLVGANGASSGLGLRNDDGDEDDQFALRAQFQLLF